MPAPKPVAKTFQAVLERTTDRLHWVIVRIPVDVDKVWGKRGQLRIQGEINGFSFGSTLFPTGKGEHFLIVNKKMQAGGKTAPGLTAKFLIKPDLSPPAPAPPARELLRELGQSKRLLRFYESFSPSRRREMAKWIAQPASQEARRRRSQQLAERLMETMDAERELPPLIQLAFRQNPIAAAEWERMSQSHRRTHLFAIFYYRRPEARARRIGKCIEEIMQRVEKGDSRARRVDTEYD
jgi:Domain of unknown function (DUF1905)/Bacteriocin-protection, YdeI or OmpD-Associated